MILGASRPHGILTDVIFYRPDVPVTCENSERKYSNTKVVQKVRCLNQLKHHRPILLLFNIGRY